MVAEYNAEDSTIQWRADSDALITKVLLTAGLTLRHHQVDVIR